LKISDNVTCINQRLFTGVIAGRKKAARQGLFAEKRQHAAGEKAPAGNAQGIEAEIPEALGTKAEELERKARFPAFCAGNAPKRGGCKFLCAYPSPPGRIVKKTFLWHYYR
jgi:hypothetical protein